MSSRKLSVCIPAYNSEKYISETISSILEQTYRDFELIIVDNCSQDRTPDIIASYNDPRIKLFRNKQTVSAAQNWNICLSYAKGEFVALFHADDIYLPTILEEEIKVMETQPSVGAVFALAEYINKENLLIKKLSIPPGMSEITFLDHEKTLNLTMRYECIFFCSTAMIRKNVLDKTGGFDDNNYKYVFDLDMWLKLSQNSQLCIIGKKLMKYRISSSQGSTSLAATGSLEHYKAVDRYIKKLTINKKISINYFYYLFVKYVKYITYYLGLKNAIKYIIRRIFK